VDRYEVVNTCRRRQIHEIAVHDNAPGMDAKTRRDPLQFGMGPAKGSISQRSKFDVSTWQNDERLYSYLDVEEIEKGRLNEVPAPTPGQIPGRWW
jgi:hypothetical protein